MPDSRHSDLKMTLVELTDSLRALGWTLDEREKSVDKTFTFPSFKDAFAFMTAVAREAERLNHHPDWRNVYTTVWISLTTHDTQGLSILDLHLARACDRLAREFQE